VLFLASAVSLAAQTGGGAEENGTVIFSWNNPKTGVSLFLNGYWDWQLTGSAGIVADPFRWGPAAVPPVLFTQQADLTLALWIRERWFVEGRFQEDAKLNTYRAGFQGKSGDTLRYLGIGNTGLDFPAYPYLNLGGTTPASIGVYGQFGSDTFQLHGLFRYDDAVREERVFSGGREQFESYLPPEAAYRAVSFVLPDDGLAAVPVVYLEDKDGALAGSDGRRWRQAAADEYAASAAAGLVELASPADGRVAVYYPGGYNQGSYAPNEGFLGQVREYFAGAASPADVANYPQPGGGSTPAVINIDGREALVVYEKGTFSPFERLSRYQAPAGDIERAYLADSATGARRTDYTLDVYEETSAFTIEESDFAVRYAARVYELRHSSGRYTPRDVETRWPLAHADSAIYLPGGYSSGELRLEFIAYGLAGGYVIGTGIVETSIQVTRGGLAETGFRFDAQTGTVSLTRPAAFNETIRISYLRLSTARRGGSIALAAGFTWERPLFAPPPPPEAADDTDTDADAFTNANAPVQNGALYAGAAAGARWNVDANTYSQGDSLSPGTVGAAAYTRYERGGLSGALRIGGAYGQEDTSGLYRAASMEGSEAIIDITGAPSQAASAPARNPADGPALAEERRAPLVFRDYQDKSVFGGGELLPIEQDAPVVAGKNAPYPARDTTLKNRTLVTEFSLNEAKNWTGWTVELSPAQFSLAREIELPFRFYGWSGSGDIAVYIQFGEIANGESVFQDEDNRILTRRLYPSADAGTSLRPDFQGGIDSRAHIAGIQLSDADRRRLQNTQSARLVIVRQSGECSGRLLVAPPVTRGAQFRPLVVRDGSVRTQDDTLEVRAVEIADDSLDQKESALMRRLHPNGERERVLNVSWNHAGDAAAVDTAAGTGGTLGKAPFSAYRVLTLFVRLPESEAAGADFSTSTFSVVLGKGEAAYSDISRRCLRAEIPARALLAAGESGWVKAELRYGTAERGVFIDGKKTGELEWGMAGLAESARGGTAADAAAGAETGMSLAVFLQPPAGGSLPESGRFCIDEVLLTDSAGTFTGNLGISAAWEKYGTLIALADFPLLANIRVQTDNELSLLVRDAYQNGTPSAPSGTPSGTPEGAFSGGTNAAIDIAGFQLKGEAAVNASGSQVLWKGGHSIARFFGPVGFQERFYLDTDGSEWLHQAALFLNSVLSARLEAESQNRTEQNRQWKASLGKPGPGGFSLDARLHYSATGARDTSGQYIAAWTESFRPLVPDSGASAEKRLVNLRAGFNDSRALLWGTAADAAAAPDSGGAPSGAGIFLRLDGTNLYEDASGREAARSEIETGVPVAISGYKAVFSLRRAYERALLAPARDIFADLDTFAAAHCGALPLYAQAPLYSLFDPAAPDRFTASVQTAAGGALIAESLFQDEYRLTLDTPAFAGGGAARILVPRQVEAYTRREISRKLDSSLDKLLTGFAVRHSAVNIAGAYSPLALFRFYQNDELDSTISAEWSLPHGGTASWRVQTSQLFSFYGFKGASLDFEDVLTFREKSWTLLFTLYWTVPAANSLLGRLYDWALRRAPATTSWTIVSALKTRGASRLRREKLETRVNKTEEGHIDHAITAGHESIIRLGGSFTLSTFAELSTTFSAKTSTFTLLASTGLKLNVVW
jgi:hypothetical protein